MKYILIILISYLLGCSNMAWYLARFQRADLQAAGTGNLGASNVTMLLGLKAGILTAVHDVAKATLAVFLAGWLFPSVEYGKELAGVACVMGHIFPFWLKFRGGKGFASYVGMTLALNWRLAIGVVLAVILVTLITDYIVCGTLTTIFSVPIYLIIHGSWISALILISATLVILYKHRKNIVQIFNKTEPKVISTLLGKHKLKK